VSCFYWVMYIGGVCNVLPCLITQRYGFNDAVMGKSMNSIVVCWTFIFVRENSATEFMVLRFFCLETRI
jgi:hypothetical protein